MFVIYRDRVIDIGCLLQKTVGVNCYQGLVNTILQNMSYKPSYALFLIPGDFKKIEHLTWWYQTDEFDAPRDFERIDHLIINDLE